MQSGLYPGLRVGAHLLGTDRHDVSERVCQVVLVAVGRKDRPLDGRRVIADVAGVVGDQDLGLQALAVDQSLRDHEIHAGVKVWIGDNRPSHSRDLS